VLGAIAAVPVLAAGATLARAARRTIAASRPAPIGRSAALCGACGATTHAMLDPACPATPKVV
jgi:hypothetical protein